MDDQAPVRGTPGGATPAERRLGPKPLGPGDQLTSTLRLTTLLGRGGMGAVYRAHDAASGRDVAVKVLLPGGSGSNRNHARFEREVEVLARLRHPNIVMIHGAGEARGQPYMVLELVEGPSLHDLLNAGPIEHRHAAALALKLARALEAAHQHGVLHRDVKPANVLLNHAGEPMLADFGVARDLQSQAESLTRTGSMTGTPSYWSPEQARGDKDAMGPHTDVYSLGAMLYELLSGELPFHAGSLIELMVATQEKVPKPPSSHCPEISTDLDAITLKCLEKNPADRYSSAAALAEDLQRYLDGSDVAASSARSIGWLAPRRRLPLVAGAVTVCAVGLLFWVGTRTQPSTNDLAPANDPADARPGPAENGKPAESAEQKAARHFESKFKEIRALHEAFRFDELLAACDALEKELAPGSAERRKVGLERVESAFKGMAVFHKPPPSPQELTNLRKLEARGYTGYEARGTAFYKAAALEEAIRDLTTAIELDSTKYRPYVYRGRSHAGLSQFAEAERDFSTALRLFGANTELYCRRARARRGLGDLVGSRSDFTTSLEAERPFGPHLAHFDLAWAHMFVGDYTRAADSFTRAIPLMRRSPAARLGYGYSLAALGRLDEAAAALLHPEARPVSPRDLFKRGLILKRAGKHKQAKTDFKRCLKRLPKDSPARATVLKALGRLSELER